MTSYNPLLMARALAERERRERLKLRATQKKIPTYYEWLRETASDYNWDWPHLVYVRERIDSIIQGLLYGFAPGQKNRLMIFMPPRHGKSSIGTIRLPAYLLEVAPWIRVISGAYNQDLADKFSRQTRRIAQGRVAIAPDRNTVSEWETLQNGGLRAVGVGGGVTGHGANLGLIDDPVKSREEANSQTYREKVWEWYTDDFYTRLEPGAAIILIMCMTGDTPVLMANGTERNLRDIKIGDHVATFDNGRLKTSRVLNHKSNGNDSVFRIKMSSGKVVHANERHPFLVEDGGLLKWVRLKNLTTAHKIVTLKGSGENGEAKTALLRNVSSQRKLADIAHPTTTKKCEQMVTSHLHATNLPIEKDESKIGMALHMQTMNQCLPLKTANVQSVSNHLGVIFGHTGEASFVSTIATKQKRLERYCAMTAISRLDIQSLCPMLLQLPSTSDFISEQIVSIEPAGIQEVFDIQIERTENFIANGLVSHNTRWHQDDLAGRILASDDAPKWEVVNLPAIAELDDPLGRAEGDPLCPDRYPLDRLLELKTVLGASFQALFQQRPTAVEGAIFKREYWRYFKVAPDFKLRVLSIDTAFKTKTENDYSVINFYGKTDIGSYHVDRWKQKVEYPDLKRAVISIAERFKPHEVLIEDKASGQSLIQELRRGTNLPIKAIQVDKDKVARANASVGFIEAGKLFLPESVPWVLDYVDNMAAFPNGAHDDDVDATTQYLSRHGFKTPPEIMVV